MVNAKNTRRMVLELSGHGEFLIFGCRRADRVILCRRPAAMVGFGKSRANPQITPILPYHYGTVLSSYKKICIIITV